MTECDDCKNGLPKSADGSNHLVSKTVGDVRRCKAFGVDEARELARTYAEQTRFTHNVFQSEDDNVFHVLVNSQYTVNPMYRFVEAVEGAAGQLP